MKKRKIIIIGILALGLILAVSVMFFNEFSKQGLVDEPYKAVNDILQSEEESDTEADTEVIFDDSKFVDSEPATQSEQKNAKYSEESEDSSGEKENQNSSNQDIPEQVENSDSTQERGEESDKEELWTGYY